MTGDVFSCQSMCRMWWRITWECPLSETGSCLPKKWRWVVDITELSGRRQLLNYEIYKHKSNYLIYVISFIYVIDVIVWYRGLVLSSIMKSLFLWFMAGGGPPRLLQPTLILRETEHMSCPFFLLAIVVFLIWRKATFWTSCCGVVWKTIKCDI